MPFEGLSRPGPPAPTRIGHSEPPARDPAGTPPLRAELGAFVGVQGDVCAHGPLTQLLSPTPVQGFSQGRGRGRGRGHGRGHGGCGRGHGGCGAWAWPWVGVGVGVGVAMGVGVGVGVAMGVGRTGADSTIQGSPVPHSAVTEHRCPPHSRAHPSGPLYSRPVWEEGRSVRRCPKTRPVSPDLPCQVPVGPG